MSILCISKIFIGRELGLYALHQLSVSLTQCMLCRSSASTQSPGHQCMPHLAQCSRYYILHTPQLPSIFSLAAEYLGFMMYPSVIGEDEG